MARARLIPPLIAIPVFLVVRAVCLHTLVGFRYGSNRSLAYRFAIDILGTLSQFAVTGNWAPLILGSTLVLLWLVLQWRGQKYGGMHRLPIQEWLVSIGKGVLALSGMALPAVVGTGYADFNPSLLVISLLTYAVPETLLAGMVVAVYLGAMYNLVRKQPQIAMFCYLFALMAFLPTLVSPSVLHRFYLMNAGYALLLGAGLTWIRSNTRPQAQ